MSLPLSPGRVVRDDLVHAADVDGVLGRALVVAHAGVLEPVAPQDLIGQVRGADLALEIYLYLCIQLYCLACTVFPVSGVIPSKVTIISNCFLQRIKIIHFAHCVIAR